MAKPEKIDQARQLVADILSLNSDQVDENAGIDNLQEWTSIKHIEVIREIEARIGHSLEIDQIISATSVIAVADLLAEV